MAGELPPSFRKMPAQRRREVLLQLYPQSDTEPTQDLDWADRLVENAFGWRPLPLGLVPDFPVNGKTYHLPLATEEPSVIAAASFSGRMLARHGGIRAEATPAILRGQLFLEGADFGRWPEVRVRIQDLAAEGLVSMSRRGGGLRKVEGEQLANGLTLLTFWVDVCDAQGANVVNTLLEGLVPKTEELLGGKRLMAILSNNSPERLGRAEFSIPIEHLARSGFSGPEMARRLCLASEAAQLSTDRAVTHNKGIMNGVTALALATGNDTRALEAAVHAYAARNGGYQPLSRYRSENGQLIGMLEMPLPLATVGGGTRSLPQSGLIWDILGITRATELMEVAAALGLAQNFAALMALCAEGIQSGHMKLHQRRLTGDEKP